jgi:hypothetical protein
LYSYGSTDSAAGNFSLILTQFLTIHKSFTTTMSSDRSLTSVYSEALSRYEHLHQEGQINASQLALIQQQTGLADVLTAVKEAEAKNENERNAVDRRFHSISPQVVAKIERFTGVVDSAVQSSMFIPAR